MLKAIDEKDNLRVSYIDGNKTEKFYCPNPVCGLQVLFRKCTCKINHFAHFPNKSCDVGEEKDSIDHDTLKKIVFDKLKQKYKEAELRYEEWLENQRADLYFPKSNIAVECQLSPIQLEEFQRRNRKYEKKGVSVIWIFGNTFWKEYKERIGTSIKTTSVIKEIFKLYGRFYVVRKGEIFSVHLKPLKRWSQNFAFSAFDIHQLNTDELYIIPNINNTNLARFADKRWW